MGNTFTCSLDCGGIHYIWGASQGPKSSNYCLHQIMVVCWKMELGVWQHPVNWLFSLQFHKQLDLAQWDLHERYFDIICRVHWNYYSKLIGLFQIQQLKCYYRRLWLIPSVVQQLLYGIDWTHGQYSYGIGLEENSEHLERSIRTSTPNKLYGNCLFLKMLETLFQSDF